MKLGEALYKDQQASKPKPEDKKKDNFNEKIESLLKEDLLCGLNLTIPFKEKIIPHLTSIDKHSSIIGAVNCVTKNKNTLK